MPELPEVETVRRGLHPYLDQARMHSVTLNRANLRFPFPPRFAQRLCAHPLGSLSRHAKYLQLDLPQSREILLIHLGMSGRFRIEADPSEYAPERRHDHVVFCLSDGAKLIFNDARRFGFMEIWPDAKTCPRLTRLGPDILSDAFHVDFLHAALKQRSAPIKSLLLDQAVCAGMGNIYACEALFSARLHPAIPASHLRKAQIERLVLAVQSVLQQAIEAGGTSLRDHARPDGTLGYFQNQLAVYGKQDAPCPACQTPIARLVQSGRSSFFCPACQA